MLIVAVQSFIIDEGFIHGDVLKILVIEDWKNSDFKLKGLVYHCESTQ